MIIRLHIGAHKTATTHIQNLLNESRKLLTSFDIKLSIPADNRNKWLNNFFKYCNTNNNDQLKNIISEKPIHGDWILSEENISGVSYDFLLCPGIYPHLKKRLLCFRKIFQHDHIQIFFSIRSYDTFYRSAYLEVVRNKGYLPFSKFYDNERFKNNSWLTVIDAFASIFPEESITIWCYEEFRPLLPEIINRITGHTIASELISAYKVETTRPSLSNKSLKILATLYPNLTPKYSMKLIDYLNKNYPANSENGYYMPFNTDEVEAFQEKYNNHTILIKQRYPHINFLTP